MLSENVKQLVARGDRLKSARANLDSVWDDVSYYYGAPEDITSQRAPGTERTPLEDASTVHAWRGFSLSLGGLLRPRGMKWLKPKFSDDEINDNDLVEMWRDIVGDRMHSAINAVAARAAHALKQSDEQLTLYGVAFVFVDEDLKTSRLRFRSFHVRDCYLDVDYKGEVDTVYRYFRLTASDAAKEFGEENIHEDVRRAIKDDSGKMWKFVHITLPNDQRQTQGIKTNLPIASLHIDCENDHIVKEGGFHEFPWIVPRDGVPAGWKYGYSICMANLPDARTVQEIAAAISDASEYQLSPPLLANDIAVVGDVSLQPDGITYFDPTKLSGNRPAVEKLDIGGDVPVGLEEQRNKRETLFQGFMQDVLNLPLQSGMSVPEIIRRNEDFARMVAPITDPLLPDYNGQIGERVFGIMLRANQFPGGAAGPIELQGHEVLWEYENPISRAEEENGNLRAQESIAAVVEISAVDPSVLDEIDLAKFARHTLMAKGAHEFLRDPKAVEQLRAQRQQAEQMASMPAQAIEASEAITSVNDALQAVK
jgi:hypothetical protein